MASEFLHKIECPAIEWKNPDKPDGTAAFYFNVNNLTVTEKHIAIGSNGVINFLTFFNLFNWSKWQKYTGIQNLTLQLMLEGEFFVHIYSHTTPNTLKSTSTAVEVLSKKISCDGSVTLDVPVVDCHSIISFKLEAINNGKFYGGAWISEIEHTVLRRPRIALVMVTYKRDEYLFKNLELLKKQLPDAYSVFIVDNANRIPKAKITQYGSRFRLFPNNNTGGSGGFTRGLIEAIRDDEDFSHVHFMDDDVTIELSSLKRTSVLLSLLKIEYRDAFISGAMFRMDTPWVLHESTARWNGLRILINKNKLDMLKQNQLLFNEKEEPSSTQYAAWWYCVIPVSRGIEDDLPLPFFIYGDDIEYSLRRAQGIIAWNGLCVWHEPFEKKHSSVLKSYFLCRNLLIINTLHYRKYGIFHVFVSAAAHFFVQIFVHDYNSAALVLDAYRDYLNGADFFLSCANEAILIEKRNSFPEMIPYNEKSASGYFPIQLHYKKFKAPFYFFKKKIAAFDFERQNMELRRRSPKRAACLSWHFFKLSLQFSFKYFKVKRSYKEQNFDISFWDAKNIPDKNKEPI